MNRLPKDKRDKIIIVAAVTLLVSVGLWFVLLAPLRAQHAGLRRQIEDSARQVEAGIRTLAAAAGVSNELVTVTARLQAAEATMASGDLYAWVIQTMNQFKQPYAVDIPQISRETPCEVGVFPKFPYRAAAFLLRGSACYHDLGKFIAGLENSFPYMRVQNLELEPITQTETRDEDRDRLGFRLELVALVKPVTP